MLTLMKYRNLLIKALISLLIIGVLAWRMDTGELKKIAHEISITAWVAALGFIFLQILALSYRWMALANVNHIRGKLTYVASLRISLASLLANYLFITSIGGIIVRVALTVQQGVSFIKAIASATLDRLMTVVGLLILATIFLPVLYSAVSEDIFMHTVVVIAISVAVSVALAFFMFKNVRKNMIFANRKIAVGFKYLRSVARDVPLLCKITLASLAGQMAYFAAVYVIAVSTGVHFSLLSFMAVLPMMTLVASLPIGYGGWGVREGAFIYGLGLIHVPMESAFVISVQIGLVSMLAALAFGIPVLMSGETQFALKNWRNLKMRKAS